MDDHSTGIKQGHVGRKIIISCHSCRLPPGFAQCTLTKNVVTVSTSKQNYVSVFNRFKKRRKDGPIDDTFNVVKVVATKLSEVTNFNELPDMLRGLISSSEEGPQTVFKARSRIMMKWKSDPKQDATLPENVLFTTGEDFFTYPQGIFLVNGNGTIEDIASEFGLKSSQGITLGTRPRSHVSKAQALAEIKLIEESDMSPPRKQRLVDVVQNLSSHQTMKLGSHYFPKRADVNEHIARLVQTDQYVLLSDILTHDWINDGDLVVLLCCNGICGVIPNTHGVPRSYKSSLVRQRSADIEQNITKIEITNPDTVYTSGAEDEMVDWGSDDELSESDGGSRRNKGYNRIKYNRYKKKYKTNKSKLYRHTKNNYRFNSKRNHTLKRSKRRK
jgi:hypothetical protein